MCLTFMKELDMKKLTKWDKILILYKIFFKAKIKTSNKCALKLANKSV